MCIYLHFEYEKSMSLAYIVCVCMLRWTEQSLQIQIEAHRSDWGTKSERKTEEKKNARGIKAVMFRCTQFIDSMEWNFTCLILLILLVFLLSPLHYLLMRLCGKHFSSKKYIFLKSSHMTHWANAHLTARDDAVNRYSVVCYSFCYA